MARKRGGLRLLARMAGGIAAYAARRRAAQPTLGSEVQAMGREIVKDVRAALHQVFWNQPEGAGELGAPLNRTQDQANTAAGTRMTMAQLRGQNKLAYEAARQRRGNEGPQQGRSAGM